MSEPILLKKMGAKQILGDVRAVVNTMCEKDGDSYPAYTIFGYTDGIKRGTSNYGEWVAFTGSMEAINYVTEERYQSKQCFIPEPLSSMLVDALSEHERIEFAFTVQVKRRDNLAEGYEYVVVPHKQVREADPLEHLRKLIPATAQKAARLKAPEPA